MYKPELLITQNRKQISTRSQGLLQYFGAFHIPSPAALESTPFDGVRRQKTASGANFQFWYNIYFRFVSPDAVLRSRILSTPVEVDRSPSGLPYKTLPQLVPALESWSPPGGEGGGSEAGP